MGWPQTACVISILTAGTTTSALALDVATLFLPFPSPACPGAQVVDKLVSVCEIDAANIPLNKCHERVPVHKVVVLASCPVITGLPVLVPEPSNAKGRVLRALLAGIRFANPPPQPDIFLSGPYMPAQCADAAKAIENRPYGPGWFASIDKEHPQWRNCLTQHAQAFQAALPTHPYVISVNTLQAILGKIDLHKPTHYDRVKGFLAALDAEPVRPTLDRVAEMLGPEWD
jgi:hypothetical protein